MLDSLGLDMTADSVYRTLIQQPGISVSEIAGALNLQEAEVRESLDALADLALVRSSWQDPELLLPVNPEVALQVILAERQAELVRRQQEIEEIRAAAARLASDCTSEYSYGRGQGFELLTSVEAVRIRMDELVAATEQETLAFAPGGPQTAENRAASRPLADSLLARAVVMKTIYLDSVRNDPGSLEHALWLSEKGGETRTTPTLPLRLQILDRRFALVPINPDDSSQGAILVEQPGVVSALCDFFSLVWESATPLTGMKSRTVVGCISPQEKELLRLLSHGMTDGGAARKLGISLRTERRMITDISARLDAQSRFQLGQRATEGGLLSP
ncbi:helix-turn-helix transcriptional regulator [Streptomyces sp. NPDC052236]|uniref:helix-turn-helix transcriptional regulator n=1 Tax=Streptomyces sp. NPDC052236 TaxID=3365686 RepID=UPI0037D44F20